MVVVGKIAGWEKLKALDEFLVWFQQAPPHVGDSQAGSRGGR
jgi:hypothetical protein